MSTDLSKSNILKMKKKRILSKEEVESKVLEHFPNLNKNSDFGILFSSYDFHPEEAPMMDQWNNIINYMYESIFNTFGMSIDNILNYTKFKNSRPIGLPNILTSLRERGDYITSKDIMDDNFYRKRFPELFAYENTWGRYFKNAFYNIGSYALSYVYTPSDSTQHEEIPKSEIFFNYRLLNTHCSEHLMDLLKQYCEEKHTDVITFEDFKNLINDNSDAVPFGDSFLDLSLCFLEKTKRVALFEVGQNSQEMQSNKTGRAEIKNAKCIKLLKDVNDIVTPQDVAKMQIKINQDIIQTRIDEIQKLMNTYHERAKEYYRIGKKDMASKLLQREKMQKKVLDNYSNIQVMLEENLLNLDNAESNLKVSDVLMKSTQALKGIMINTEKFDALTDDIRSQGEQLSEIGGIMNNYNEDTANERGVDEELAAMEKDINMNLPSANKENIISQKAQQVPEKDKPQVQQNAPQGNDKMELDNLEDKNKDELDKMLENLEQMK
ncbi:MAG: SNF7 family protein [archaeon]|nr:SNF7 family protein [archaeon]